MHKYLSYFTITLFLLACSTGARAQDARFSQLGATPQLTNPALTGMIPGQLRFTANYRELYGSVLGDGGYRSVAAGVEARRPAGNGNFYGLGAQFQRDQAGESDFIRTQGLVGGSYQQHLGGGRGRGNVGHFLTAGAQVGLGQRGYDFNKLWFSNQYFVDGNTREAYIDNSLPSGEAFTGRGTGTYLDFNAGIGWFGSFDNRRGAYVGAAVYHLNKPNVSSLPGVQDLLDQRFVINGGGELPLGSGEMSLLPAGRVMLQGPGTDVLLGSNVRYTERRWREVALRAGVWLSVSNQAGGTGTLAPNAWIISVGLETENLQFGVNYDISVGDLNTVTNNRGGFELSMIYVQKANYRQKVICPKF